MDFFLFGFSAHVLTRTNDRSKGDISAAAELYVLGIFSYIGLLLYV